MKCKLLQVPKSTSNIKQLFCIRVQFYVVKQFRFKNGVTSFGMGTTFKIYTHLRSLQCSNCHLTSPPFAITIVISLKKVAKKMPTKKLVDISYMIEIF